jgi:formylglycine-generating enzyme required for sulfatase activity
MSDPSPSPEELRKIEAAIQAQEALRGILPDEQIETILASLTARREQILIDLQGSGAIAVGRGAKALGQEAILIEGDIDGDFVGPGAQKIVKHYYGPEGTDPLALRRAYLNRVLESSSHLSLAGVDPKAASDAETRLSLSAVYTALLTLRTEELGRGGVAQPKDAGYGLRRFSALEQLNSFRRLVLLGDPGSGKSTFARFVALCMAGEMLAHPEANLALLTTPLPITSKFKTRYEEQKPQPWDHGALLPVMVTLRDFAAHSLPAPDQPATADHLWQFIVTELSAAALADFAPYLRKELLESGGLLLLDGLDEVPEAQLRRLQIKQAIEDFAATFPRCRILVTSRTYAYQKQGWSLSGFEAAELAPFSREQINTFVDRWYAHIAALRNINRADVRGRAELLKRAILASDRLIELAVRPLLLTLMASLHAWRGGTLPNKREQLYADAVDLLLDWWESPKAVRDARGEMIITQPSLAEWLRVDRDKVRSFLNKLAFQAHSAQPELVGTADIPEEGVVYGLMRLAQNPDVNPARLVEYLSQRAGLIIPRGEAVYTFPHRTFQEYLAACYLTDHGYPERVTELVWADLDRWREVALLAGAKAARGGAFALWALVECLCPKETDESVDLVPDSRGGLLAGQALVENAELDRMSEIHHKKVKRVKRWLVHILEQATLSIPERARAGNALAELGDPRFDPEHWYLPAEPMLGFVEIPEGSFTMGSDPAKDPSASEAELPQHVVDLPTYYIARYPVTVAQYRSFYQESDYRPLTPNALLGVDNHPTGWIGWHVAVEYCRWLTRMLRQLAQEKMGKPGSSSEQTFWEGLAHGTLEVSLPSEAEWEKAARGGDDRLYPWGDEFDLEKANTQETGLNATTSVGCFPGGASPYGILDMCGNVWEWTRNLWGTNTSSTDYKYPYQRDDGREDILAALIIHRIQRGGSVLHDSSEGRCAYRRWLNPGNYYRNVGFRVVVTQVK